MPSANPLIPEATLLENDQEISQLVEKFASEYSVNFHDDCGTAFRHFLLFSHRESLLAIGLSNLDDETILYNRYYWFLKFSKLRSLKHGYDAGFEQQAFQLLESAECGFDWSVIESISQLATKDG